MPRIVRTCLLLGAVGLIGQTQAATAQQFTRNIRTPSVNQLSNRYQPRQARHALGAPSRPSVSPYLNLMNSDASQPTYQTLVRPQVEQLRTNSNVSRAIGQLNSGVSNNAAAIAGSTNVRPTGRQGVHLNGFYGYKSHYYSR